MATASVIIVVADIVVEHAVVHVTIVTVSRKRHPRADFVGDRAAKSTLELGLAVITAGCFGITVKLIRGFFRNKMGQTTGCIAAIWCASRAGSMRNFSNRTLIALR